MKIAGSILKIKDDKIKIEKMITSGIDYLHLDVMDGKFVDNKSLSFDECFKMKDLYKIPLDIHLMVKNSLEYINKFINLEPKIISFHIETDNVDENIEILKNNNVLVGIALNPTTDIDKIIPYLNDIDLVLVMSVDPGYGGQTFNDSILEKIEFLNNYKISNNLNYLIEVDGGINIDNIKKINSDIVVIGSGITNYDDYSKQVLKIKEFL